MKGIIDLLLIFISLTSTVVEAANYTPIFILPFTYKNKNYFEPMTTDSNTCISQAPL